jgi:hypothetical protein
MFRDCNVVVCLSNVCALDPRLVLEPVTERGHLVLLEVVMGIPNTK